MAIIGNKHIRFVGNLMTVCSNYDKTSLLSDRTMIMSYLRRSYLLNKELPYRAHYAFFQIQVYVISQLLLKLELK